MLHQVEVERKRLADYRELVGDAVQLADRAAGQARSDDAASDGQRSQHWGAVGTGRPANRGVPPSPAGTQEEAERMTGRPATPVSRAARPGNVTASPEVPTCRIDRLISPPRRVPLATACAAMLGLTGRIGGAFLVVGLPLEWVLIQRGVGHPFPLALVGVFPTVGLILFTGAALHGIRHIVLLRSGIAAYARQSVRRATSMFINGQPVVRMEYQFLASDGRPYQGVARTTTPHAVGDDRREPVVYLPNNPRISLLLDTLPLVHPLDVDEVGQWVSYDGLGSIAWLAVIWASIALAVAYALLQLLGIA